MSRSDPPPGASGNVVQLPTRSAIAEPTEGRDDVDRLLTKALREMPTTARRSLETHPDEECLIAHLKRSLPEAQRRSLIRHLVDCELCCDRLDVAAELFQVEQLQGVREVVSGAALGGMFFDIGRALMQMTVSVEASCLRVLSCDAEVRLGLGAVLRKPGQVPGVAFQRQLDLGRLQVALLGTRSGNLHLSLGLEGAPVGCRASLLVAGKLLTTEPFKHNQLFFRDVPIRTLLVRIEAPKRTLGHVRLALQRGEEGE